MYAQKVVGKMVRFSILRVVCDINQTFNFQQSDIVFLVQLKLKIFTKY